ncbi:MAG: Hsp70 family protein, partial [Pirellulales bacterium]
HGAAVLAGVLLSVDEEERRKLIVTNVNSHDLGVLAVEGKTGRPRRKVLIPRNTALPANGTGGFSTRDENQRSVVVNVIEGGDASGTNSTPIGRCIIRDLPEQLPAQTKIAVRFSYREDGRLKVKAWLPKTKQEATIVLERASGLSEEDIMRWIDRIESGKLFDGSDEDWDDEAVAGEVVDDNEHGPVESVEDLEEFELDEAHDEADDEADEGSGDGALDDFLKGLP